MPRHWGRPRYHHRPKKHHYWPKKYHHGGENPSSPDIGGHHPLHHPPIFVSPTISDDLKKIALTVFLILIGAIVISFMGVQPLASIKDKGIAWVGQIWGTTVPSTFVPISPAPTPEDATNTVITSPPVVDEKEIQTREHEIVDLVNTIRMARGSSPLIWDDILYGYSKSHSEDMAKQGRLFHTPVGAPYGENTWWGWSYGDDWGAKEIVNSWMISEKHRTWLLCPHLQHIAVGIAKSDHSAYVSWTFWIDETQDSDWWYQYNLPKPDWWY